MAEPETGLVGGSFAGTGAARVGWFGTAGNPEDSLPKGFSRSSFELTQIVPLVALIGISALLYRIGRRRT